MKLIRNNQENILMFVTSNYSFNEVTKVRMKQLGGSGNIDILISDSFSDCYTCSITIPLSENQVSNGLYILELLNDLDEVINTSTIKVSGYDESNPRAFIVEDDTINSEQIILN